ncbi:MAG: DUF1059 domain-containing protein [Anaerolineae bacterium]|nr:DUF1059 domain-containing protein [Anaerolineae bacterium]
MRWRSSGETDEERVAKVAEHVKNEHNSEDVTSESVAFLISTTTRLRSEKPGF